MNGPDESRGRKRVRVRTRVPRLLAYAALCICISSPAVALAMATENEQPRGPFQFTPVPASSACTDLTAVPSEKPFIVPPGYEQIVFEREAEPRFPNSPDMNTVNEQGAGKPGALFGIEGSHVGRFLFRTHEVRENGAVTVTDMETVDDPGGPVTRTLARRPDWERLDGIRWTPWGTILAAEEVDNPRNAPVLLDPRSPESLAGLVYEIDPETGAAQVRPAIGSRSHEGLDFDPQGNLYGISEEPAPNGGFIYRFVPDHRGDLASGQLYALKVASGETGPATWIPLDRATVRIDSDATATAAGATPYQRPEDVEIGRNATGTDTMFVAVTGFGPTGVGQRVLAIDLREPRGTSDHDTAYVTDYVTTGGELSRPDNLDLDPAGNLYITEDQPPANRVHGNDIWVATPDEGNDGTAEAVFRFATLKECRAEPTGIYFDERNPFGEGGPTLYVNVMRTAAGNNPPIRHDLAVAIMEDELPGLPMPIAGLLTPDAFVGDSEPTESASD